MDQIFAGELSGKDSVGVLKAGVPGVSITGHYFF